MPSIKKIFLLIFCCLLSACQTSGNVMLSSSEKSNIRATKIIVNSTQHTVVMKHNNWFSDSIPDPYFPMDAGSIVHSTSGYNPYGAGSSNLIGKLAISAIKEHGEKVAATSIVPLRQALGDFDYVSYFNRMVRQHVASLPWLKVKSQQMLFNVKESKENLLRHSEANNLLLIGTTYALNSTYKQLEVAAYVEALTNSASSQATKTTYANIFYFIYRLPEAEQNSAINAWTRNNGALLKAKLQDAAMLLSKMIALDLNQRTHLINSGIPVNFPSILALKTHGILLKQERGYSIILVEGMGEQGYLYAMPNSLVKSP